MNDDNKNVVVLPERGSVGDYIELLLMTEGKLHKNDERIQNAKNLLESTVTKGLSKPATKFNVSAFVLALAKKNPSVASYYISLLHKYEPVQSELPVQNPQNAFDILENLLYEANLIVNPQNEIHKYFA